MDTQSGTAGDIFLQWMLPLHSGDAFGLPGRLLVCLDGLLCPVLYLTVSFAGDTSSASQHFMVNR
ncbi:MAG: PepSY domain-containing protein [Deltaproteobacteria bacterium]|nr:PepSY domain-containing protein [Deltaproteobacteria bacterium]